MAVGDAHVFPGFLTPVLTQISFQSHRLLFSHVSAELRGENTPERIFDSKRSRTHNHQVMSPTRSPLSHPGGAVKKEWSPLTYDSQRPSPPLNPFPNKPWVLHVYSASPLKTLWEKEKLLVTSNFSFSHSVLYPFRELYAISSNFKIVVCKLFQNKESKICCLGKD